MVCWQAVGSVILPNVGGFANGLYFAGQIKKGAEKTWYDNLKKPTWIAPKWVFAPIWSSFYCTMGYSAYMVYDQAGGFTEEAILPLSLYGTQLLLNWSWTPIFFGLKDFKMALIEISVLDCAAAATTLAFYRVNKNAGLLLLPYLAWLAYATSLTHYVWKNNPKPAIKAAEDEKKN